MVRHRIEGHQSDALTLGRSLARRLIEMGADKILKEIIKDRA
jgi:hypothetical protein